MSRITHRFLYFAGARSLVAVILLVTGLGNDGIGQTAPGGVLTSAACRLWVDAGDINGDDDYTNNPALNSQVATWVDKSGNGNNLTQGTSANRPIYNTLAGTSVVRFDNTGTAANFLNATSQTTLNPGTMYFVLRMSDAGDGGNCLFDRSGNGNTSLRYEQWNNTGFVGYTSYGGGDYTSTITSNYASNVIVSYLKTSASNNVDIGVNNQTVNLTVPATNPGLPLYVLGKNSTVDGLNGSVMEILAYNTNLNFAQRMIIDNYLSAKYNGIAIPSDKYAGDTPLNGNFDFELGGVGNDGGGTNNQAASSITGGLRVTQATAMGAGEYLMFAHQATPINSVNTTDIGGMSAGAARGRWERVWYFDWTHVGGTNESVNLVFDFSDGDMGFTPSGATSNYKLLYRPGLTGNWTEVMNATSIASDQVTFNGLVYTQGDGYYTIGSLNTAVSPLPVTLKHFNARVCGGNVCIDWSTASERNAAYFLVQRSADAVNWTTVCSADAAGESMTLTEYACTDDFPYFGQSYYRLVQVDNDRTESYSPIASVFIEPPLNLYPNPAHGIVTMTVPDEITINSFEIVDFSGRVARIESVHDSNGKYQFDVSALPEGGYLLVAVLPNDIRLSRRVVVSRDR